MRRKSKHCACSRNLAAVGESMVTPMGKSALQFGNQALDMAAIAAALGPGPVDMRKMHP